MKEVERQSEISLSEEWVALSEAMYGPDFVNELSELMRQHHIKTVLECGCGDGYILRELGEQGFTGLGIDAEESMISMANKKNVNPNINFQKLNWLELDQIEEKFDMVMCRGNSLSSVSSWGKNKDIEFDVQKTHELIFKSLQRMYERLKKGGLFYVDTIAQNEIEQGDRNIEIDIKEIHLKGGRKFNLKNRTVATFGEGFVNGKFFKGGTISYLIYPEELKNMMEKLNSTEIWTPELEYEKNYQIFCIKK